MFVCKADEMQKPEWRAGTAPRSDTSWRSWRQESSQQPPRLGQIRATLSSLWGEQPPLIQSRRETRRRSLLYLHAHTASKGFTKAWTLRKCKREPALYTSTIKLPNTPGGGNPMREESELHLYVWMFIYMPQSASCFRTSSSVLMQQWSIDRADGSQSRGTQDKTWGTFYSLGTFKTDSLKMQLWCRFMTVTEQLQAEKARTQKTGRRKQSIYNLPLCCFLF